MSLRSELGREFPNNRQGPGMSLCGDLDIDYLATSVVKQRLGQAQSGDQSHGQVDTRSGISKARAVASVALLLWPGPAARICQSPGDLGPG